MSGGKEDGLDRVASRYRCPGAWFLGVVVEKSWEAIAVTPGTPIACIGLEPTRAGEAEITALAVLPDWRRQGIATSLIFGTCELLGLRALEAETDADGVDFYRAVGFAVESLGQRNAEVERFRCRLELPPR
jgi:N-acetylglutamate synthase-like GNAT family acetyltransferase